MEGQVLSSFFMYTSTSVTAGSESPGLVSLKNHANRFSFPNTSPPPPPTIETLKVSFKKKKIRFALTL